MIRLGHELIDTRLSAGLSGHLRQHGSVFPGTARCPHVCFAVTEWTVKALEAQQPTPLTVCDLGRFRSLARPQARHFPSHAAPRIRGVARLNLPVR